MAVQTGERQAHFHGQTLPNLSPSRHPSTGGRSWEQVYDARKQASANRFLRRVARNDPSLRAPNDLLGRTLSDFGQIAKGTPRSLWETGKAVAEAGLGNPRPALRLARGQYQGVKGVAEHPLRHPGYTLATLSMLTPAGRAIGGRLGAGVEAYGGPAGAMRTLLHDQTGALHMGNLEGVRFLHGAPTAYRDFSYRKRNPSALLSSGLYANEIPERANFYGQMNPTTKRNSSDWFQARFGDEGKARAFARKRVALGNEVDGYVADPHFVNNDHSQGLRFVEAMHPQRFQHTVKRVTAFKQRQAPEPSGGIARLFDNRDMGGPIHLAGNEYKSLVRRRTASGDSSFGTHFVVNYRQGLTPNLRPLHVKPGTRLFDMRAPLAPGEALRARDLLLKQLRVARAAAAREKPYSAGKPEFEQQFKPHPDDLQQFTDADRLARLHAAGRMTRSDIGRMIDGALRSSDFPPRGSDLHELLDGLLQAHAEAPVADAVKNYSRDLQHITQNPNAILRGMGYHGLIDPEYSMIGPNDQPMHSREIVMFDKHRFEPYHDYAVRAAGPRGPVGVQLAKSLRNHGADLIGAIKQVRKGFLPQASLPLSDELNLNVVNIDNKVRFFLASAHHPDAVGREINGVQALNIAHRSIVQRRGGKLNMGDLTRAMVGERGKNPEHYNRPPDTDFFNHLLGNQLRDVSDAGRKLIQRHGYYESGQPGLDAAHEQTLAGLSHPKPRGSQTRQLSLGEIERVLKQRYPGRKAEMPTRDLLRGGSLNMKHTMHGVRVPDAEYLNFGHSGAKETHGMPLASFPRAPQAHEFFSHGDLVTFLERDRTPAEKEHSLQLLNEQLAQAWYAARREQKAAPHVHFPRFPNTPKSPSFGGLNPSEPSGVGRPPYLLPASMEPLGRAIKLAQKHGLKGQEARIFIREYLRNLGR